MALTIRLDDKDNKNIQKIMDLQKIATKSKAIKLALRITANILGD